MNAKGKVLLVDDHIETIDYVRSHLEKSGYAVTMVAGGAAAIEATNTWGNPCRLSPSRGVWPRT